MPYGYHYNPRRVFFFFNCTMSKLILTQARISRDVEITL